MTLPKAESAVADEEGDPPVVCIDNGGDTVKLGTLADGDGPRLHRNARGRTASSVTGRGQRAVVTEAIGAAIDALPYGPGVPVRLQRPVDRGLLTRWDLQVEIWSQLLHKEGIDLTDAYVCLTLPPLCPFALVERALRVMFGHYGVAALSVSTPAQAALAHDDDRISAGALATSVVEPGCGLVLDTGFSFSHAVPVVQGTVLNYAVRRLDVGGNVLTHYLKEQISYRAWNMMDEAYLVNHIKERMCYVSDDVAVELERGRRDRPHAPQSYVLPTYTESAASAAHRWGFVAGDADAPTAIDEGDASTDDWQVLTLSNERFLVPEMLFSPREVLSLPQCGVAELVMQSLERVPRALWPALLRRVLLVGGNVCLPGFVERFERELRALAPANMPVQVRVAGCDPSWTPRKDASAPVLAAWRGLRVLARTNRRRPDGGFWLRREEYRQGGSARARALWHDL